MKIKDIMHRNPACCTPEDSLQNAARLMFDCDCGALPVVESTRSMKLMGIITDRDIVCRGTAKGKAPAETRVGDCYSSPALTVGAEDTLDDCVRIMEENLVRRVPVADQGLVCIGMVT